MLVLVTAARTASPQSPPFAGTAFIDADVILASDWSAFESLEYSGVEERLVFDRRVNAWITQSMHLFDATFADGLTSEDQVNPEFGDRDAAELQANAFAQTIGRLPTSLRAEVESVTIHEGIEPLGGGNNNLLIHVGQALEYGQFLEEILFHEATHTSYNADHASAPEWLAAQTADGTFISTYAESFPDREDVAESLLPWFAIRHRSDRLDHATRGAIEAAIPHRLAYFDALPFLLGEPPLMGDFNASGGVEQGDLDLVLLHWGADAATPPAGWTNHPPSGLVDQQELDAVLLNWGATAANPAGLRRVSIPEPSIALLLFFAVATAIIISAFRS